MPRTRRPAMPAPRGRRVAGLVILSAGLFAGAAWTAGGCSPQGRLLFSPAQELTWPPAPAEARVRYVGAIAGAEDLQRRRSVFESLGELVAGRAEPKPFYGPKASILAGDDRLLWVADPGGRCAHLLDLEARTYQKVTRAGGEPLLSPVDVCLGPDGAVLLCDSESIAIHRFDAARGTLQSTIPLPSELRRPVAIAYAAPRDELFVVDVAAHDVKVLAPDGRLKRILGRRGRGYGALNYPCDVALDGETLWLVDAGNHRVVQWSLAGEELAAFGQIGDALGDFALPKGIAVDADGHVYVVDARFENIQVFDRQGTLLLVLGEEGTGAGEFWLPSGLSFDGRNRLWVCDTYNGRVQVFQYLPEQVPGSPTPAGDAGAPARSTEEQP